MTRSAETEELQEMLQESEPDNFREDSDAFEGEQSSFLKKEDKEKEENKPEVSPQSIKQWVYTGDNQFIGCGTTLKKLFPGVYNPGYNNSQGFYLSKMETSEQEIIQFPGTNSDSIMKEIKDFWTKGSTYREHGITYKRGILLWGPPGSGKTSILTMVIKDLVERGGICINFERHDIFKGCFKMLRKVQKDTPVVCIMEDIDSILAQQSVSEVLNILDGVGKYDNIIFLATTNYPEKLGARIINRPSRFDRRFKVDFPNDESRRIYLSHLFHKAGHEFEDSEINRWIEDTKGYTLAHLKELFTAVMILENDYTETLDCLNVMQNKKISSSQDKSRSVGFS